MDERPQLYNTGPERSPENQKWVVFNCCNEELCPKCDVPGVRIVGFFASKEEARERIEWMQSRMGEDDLVDFWMFPTFEPFLLCRSRERMQDGQYRHDKVNEIVAIRNEYLEERKKEFEEHKDYVYDPVKEKKRKDTSVNLKNPFREKTAVAAAAGKKKKVSSRTKAVKAVQKSRPSRLAMQDYPREYEIRDQEFAAIGWLKDVTRRAIKAQDAQEPVLYVYRCFATEEKAMEWIQEIAMKEIDDPPVEIVRMYGWLYPTKVDYSKVPELYANQELNSYMQRLNKEQKETKGFESWCLEKNIPIPTVDIETLGKGEYEKPQMDITMFNKEDSLIPDDQAVYVDVKPLSRQTKDWEKLEPKPKPKQMGKGIVVDRKL